MINKINEKKIEIFSKKIDELLKLRRKENAERKKRIPLSKINRELILKKTDGRCHVCGVKIKIIEMQADHVKSHASGGESNVNNFLPSCKTCNRYRWFFHPHELQLILKLGVWSRKQIFDRTEFGKLLASKYITKEYKRKVRRLTNKNK